MNKLCVIDTTLFHSSLKPYYTAVFKIEGHMSRWNTILNNLTCDILSNAFDGLISNKCTDDLVCYVILNGFSVHDTTFSVHDTTHSCRR